MTALTRRQLRTRLRQQRRQLSVGQRKAAARAFRRQLLCSLPPRAIVSLAAYVSADGELDPLPALSHPRFRFAECYLPVLDALRIGQLRFRRFRRGRPMAVNGYGIAEPHKSQPQRALWALDLLLLPAVGFDRQGNRLGMGGGYYDRALADLQRRPRRPRLVVIGYQFQCLPEGLLQVAPWDQPVDSVVTDSSWW